MPHSGLVSAVVCVLLAVAISAVSWFSWRSGVNDDDGMDEEEEEGKNDDDDMEEEGRDGGRPLVGRASEFQPLHCGVRRLHFSSRRAAPGTRIAKNKRK